MIRGILGTIAGVVAGTLVIVLIEMLGPLVYPPPPGVDLRDPAALKSFMKAAPVGALLVVLAAYAVGSFVGGAAGSLIGRRPWVGWAIGAVFMGLGLVNLLLLPHPAWFWAASLAVYLPAAWAGARMARPRSLSTP